MQPRSLSSVGGYPAAYPYGAPLVDPAAHPQAPGYTHPHPHHHHHHHHQHHHHHHHPPAGFPHPLAGSALHRGGGGHAAFQPGMPQQQPAFGYPSAPAFGQQGAAVAAAAPAAPAYPAAEVDTPALWTAFPAPDGRTYWGHAVSKRTTWVMPPSVAAEQMSGGAPSAPQQPGGACGAAPSPDAFVPEGKPVAGWQLLRHHATGKTRYTNSATGAVSTGMPKEVRDWQRRAEEKKLAELAEKRLRRASAATPPPPSPDRAAVESSPPEAEAVAPQPPQADPGAASVDATTSQPAPAPADEEDRGEADAGSSDGDAGDGVSATPPRREAAPPPPAQSAPGAAACRPLHHQSERVYGGRAERLQVFRDMLVSRKVDPRAKWGDVMRGLLSDDRYTALKTQKDREEAFGDYCAKELASLQEAEELAKRGRVSALRALLRESREAERYPISYDEAADAFGGEPAWEALENTERRACVAGFMSEEGDVRAEERRMKRHRDHNAFASLLREAGVAGPGARWADFVDSAYEKLRNGSLKIQRGSGEKAEEDGDGGSSLSPPDEDSDQQVKQWVYAKLEKDVRWACLGRNDERQEVFRTYARHLDNADLRAKHEGDVAARAGERAARAKLVAYLEGCVAEGSLTCFTQYADFCEKQSEGGMAGFPEGASRRGVFDASVASVLRRYRREKEALKKHVKSRGVSDPMQVNASLFQPTEGGPGVPAAHPGSVHSFVAACHARGNHRTALLASKLEQLKSLVLKLLQKHSEDDLPELLKADPLYDDLQELDPLKEAYGKAVREAVSKHAEGGEGEEKRKRSAEDSDGGSHAKPPRKEKRRRRGD